MIQLLIIYSTYISLLSLLVIVGARGQGEVVRSSSKKKKENNTLTHTAKQNKKPHDEEQQVCIDQ